ncbi:hypothetical protein FQN53_005645 [Emmonsiellopsis sp. PD_33]|nr:hypothetical protein FQN53_005645 [Emmonsiellopsis sp. PD_33]
MDQLRSPTLSSIKEVPGLFISDRFSARAVANIKSHNIVRILSLVSPEEVPRFEDSVAVEIRNINIDDDPTEDILEHLQDAYDWIQDGLNHRSEGTPNSTPGVLVHCLQGISRSGSFIVAFLMRKLELPFSTALDLARESRPIICPNEGFKVQLQIWGNCCYDIHHEKEETVEGKKEKPAYKAWKDNRDNLVKQRVEDVNRARFLSMATMAAHFGKRRQEINGPKKAAETRD